MISYTEHNRWWEQHEQWPDSWLPPAVVECPEDPCVLGDWFSRGFGPQRGKAYPQEQCTPEQSARMESGWRRIIEKARRIIDESTEEHRLQRSVAGLHIDDETLAAILMTIRRRYHDKATDDDDSNVGDDVNPRRSREGASESHAS